MEKLKCVLHRAPFWCAIVIMNLAANAEQGEEVRIWQSNSRRDFHEVSNPPPTEHFAPGAGIYDLEDSCATHDFLGVGVSFADASCYLLSKMPAERRSELLRMLFTDDGIGLSIGRLHVGSSDYSTEIYNYDDEPNDLSLRHFSIDRDRKYLIPIVREVKDIRPELFLFSSVWSAPGWMKTGGRMCGGWMLTRYLPTFCDYYVAYLKAYREAGLRIDALTIQNEPDTEQDSHSPTCRWHPEQEIEVAGHLLPPRLKAAGLETKIWIWDHNYDGWQRVIDELADSEMRKNVDAVAFHPYAGKVEWLDRVRKAVPNVKLQLTEMGPHIDPKKGRDLFWWSKTILGAFRHGCSSFCGWCLLLDEDGLPNTSRGHGCAGLVTVDSVTGELSFSDQYRAFRHIGPFVKRGAKVLSVPFETDEEGVEVCAFRNPDGSHVIVAGADGGHLDSRKQLQIRYRGKYLSVLLPGGSMTTILWK